MIAGKEICIVVIYFNASENGAVVLEELDLAQHLTDHGFAVSAAVVVLFKESDLAVDSVPFHDTVMCGVLGIEHVKACHAAVVGIAVLRTVSVDVDRAVDEIRITCAHKTTHELLVLGVAVCIDAYERNVSVNVFISAEAVTRNSAYTEHPVMCSEIYIAFYGAVDYL